MPSMITLNIKPLSVNEAYDPIAVKRGNRWVGQLVKSKLYKKYTQDIPLLLPSQLQLPPGQLIFLVKWYFSTKASDYDNPLKACQDLICDYYGVNDNKIYLGLIEKNIVDKGNERIEFEFLAFHNGLFDKCRELIINTDS